jgi:hypothetical protein
MKEEKDVIMLQNRSIQARRNSLEAEEGISNENSDNTSNRRLQKSESFRLERTKKMFYQALLYVGVFYITWIIPTINRIVQMGDGNSPFALAVGTAILAPMQGIWNWLVYRHGPCVA